MGVTREVRMAVRFRRRGLVGVGALVLAACGTRLPDKSFETTTTAGAAPSTTAASTTSAATVPGATTAASTSAPTTAAANTASDVGVTPTQITVGLVVSQTSPLGSETFSPPMYGARAYMQALDARGGINGRSVKVIVCDDGSTGAGNRECVRKLIEDDKVFAFVGNSIFNYAGASYVNDHGVPDIGGQPIVSVYDQYPHLFSIYGSNSPRDGTIGFGGKIYGGTEEYRWFKENLGTKVAGVVAYNQSDSLRFGDLSASALALEGYKVVREQLDFAVPNWDAIAVDMKARGVDSVFEALDSAGNVKLCQAMEHAHLAVKAKANSVQSWNESVRTDYKDSPSCRNSLYAIATTHNYMDTDQPAVAQFRADIKAAFPDREAKLSMWELEGWAAAQWFTDAATSCSAALTRTCVEAFMNRPVDYDGNGVFTPRNFVVSKDPAAVSHNCLFVAQWQDSAYGGTGGWVTRTPQAACFDVPSVPYSG
jgi:branched-chain amino acid transport system substrate-binding protein